MNASMLKMMLSGLGVNPDEILTQIGGIGQTVLEFKSQLDRIEANQARILEFLEPTLKVLAETSQDGE